MAEKGVAIVIAPGKAKRDDQMGDEPEHKDGIGMESSEFDSALSDAFDAIKAGDRDQFTASMGAAVSAKCAEMYDSSEGSEEKAAE